MIGELLKSETIHTPSSIIRNLFQLLKIHPEIKLANQISKTRTLVILETKYESSKI